MTVAEELHERYTTDVAYVRQTTDRRTGDE